MSSCRWLLFAVAVVLVVAPGRHAAGQPAEAWATLKGHKYGITSLAFTPDARVLVSGGNNGAIKLWEVISGKERAALQADKEFKFDQDLGARDKDTICSLAFSVEGKTLTVGTRRAVSGSGNFFPYQGDVDGLFGGVIVWEVATEQVTGHRRPPVGDRKKFSLKGAAGPFYCLAYSADGRMVVAGDTAGGVTVWDRASGKVRASLKGDDGRVRAVAFSSDGRRVASARTGSTVIIWDLPSGKQRAVLKGHTDNIYGIAFARGGKVLASASRDKTFRLWDTETGKARVTINERASCWSVAFSPDEKLMATGDEKGTVKLWSVAELLGDKGKE
jgi:WD40 repeat protein